MPQEKNLSIQDVFDEIIRSKAEITKSIKASEANILLKIGALQERLEQVEKENSRLKEKLEILERNSKKKSLIIFGLNEEPRDISLGSISETLKSLLKVEIKDTDISDLYSLGGCPGKEKRKHLMEARAHSSTKSFIKGNILHIGQKSYTIKELKIAQLEREIGGEPNIEITNSLAQPTIIEINKAHYVTGGTITLKCLVIAEVDVSIEWEAPIKNNEHMNITKVKHLDRKEVYLTIKTTNSIDLKIFGVNDHFIKLKDISKPNNVSYLVGTTVRWEVEIDGHPNTTFSWLNNINETVSEAGKENYEMRISNTYTYFMIKDISYADHGKYTIIGTNEYESQLLTFFLNVTGKPKISMQMSKEFQMVNEQISISCAIIANPKPEINLYYKPCFDEKCTYTQITQEIYEHSLSFNAIATQSFNRSGKVKCKAKTNLEVANLAKNYIYQILKMGFRFLNLTKKCTTIRRIKL
ncbi:hypothetical protein HHI36_009844 [Cryptolaemus montrouzieri]|uniref:Immunoglobulin I-set domain-containing protein n=1 Tax=Cryptolaemus montrouzieri TaxID=559131 RepID=A0ABD2MH02_9CUCU